MRVHENKYNNTENNSVVVNERRIGPDIYKEGVGKSPLQNNIVINHKRIECDKEMNSYGEFYAQFKEVEDEMT